MTRLSSDERRAALIQAALRVIDRDGVHGATTRAIVAEAGMSLASFHYAFRSRDEMISELIAFVVENEQQVSLAAVRPDADIHTVVRAGLQAFFDLLVSNPTREQALFELMHYSLRRPDLGELPRVQYASYFKAGRVLLESGARAAGISWSLPIDELARVLIALTDGLTLAWLADRDDEAAGLLMDFAAETIAGLAVPALAVPALTKPTRGLSARTAAVRTKEHQR
ncbi:TetR family transcriptional regulator [Glaciihabitans sp. UYNi722]|uniref:TetR/AcrR family transcriptional regulator n=1 Tax=Glaciihabitans sp. UYNi722 TaxID=3156344 RepID=UPI00339AB8C4